MNEDCLSPDAVKSILAIVTLGRERTITRHAWKRLCHSWLDMYDALEKTTGPGSGPDPAATAG